MKYVIITVGAGRIGGVFFKEMARFMSCFQNDGDRMELVLLDYQDVSQTDIVSQPYTNTDIGWNKAAVLSEVVSDSMSGENDYSFRDKIHAYDRKLGKDNAEAFVGALAGKGIVPHGYDSDFLPIITDCSNGSAGTDAGIKKLYNMWKNCMVMRPGKKEISVRAKMAGMEVTNNLKKGTAAEYTRAVSIKIAHMLCAAVIDTIIHHRLIGNISVPAAAEGNVISVKASRKKLFVCLGAGGTGGDFVKEFAKELLDYPDSYLLIIDGDTVEDKNRSRQPFGTGDLQQKKAAVLMEGLTKDYPELNGRIFSHLSYIDDVEQLDDAIREVGLSDAYVCLIGCVDNNRARQVLHMYYALHDNMVYIDSGNEFDYGQVVTAVKKNGVQMSPTAGHYFHEMLTDTSPKASEQSCGQINQSVPQHQVTNLIAADIVYDVMAGFLRTGRINGGITYFDVFEHVRNFRPIKEL